MSTLKKLTQKDRRYVIIAALLALFLGALDALIMSAAMPTIVAEIGGLPLYAWVYSAYFLSRAVSLPIFGKLADIYDTKPLFLFAIALFLISSIGAGSAQSMAFLVFCRIFQGIAAGGNFALVYIVLTEVSKPDQRAKTLSFASTVWGLSSVIGPTLGGFIVTYFSWRLIFFINIPLGLICLLGIGLFFKESRIKKKDSSIDFSGLMLFSCFILGLLTMFITGGREISWTSGEMVLLLLVTTLLGYLFYRVERKAQDPLIDLRFFSNRNFTLGNGATFFASCTIFSFFAYAPLFIQGGLGLSPFQVGLAMVSLSLGWSFGSLFLGRFSRNGGGKQASVSGATTLLIGSLMTLRFNVATTMAELFTVFFVIGIGMGFVVLSTLIIVQNSVDKQDLGVVTSLHQFGRSLGGTVGVGICGGLVTTGLFKSLNKTMHLLPEELISQLKISTESILQPHFQASISPGALASLQNSVLSGVYSTFFVAVFSSLCCLACCACLPKKS